MKQFGVKRHVAVWMLSILKCCLITLWFRSDRSRMSLTPPFFLGVVKMFDTNPSVYDDGMCSITPLFKRFSRLPEFSWILKHFFCIVEPL